MTGSRHESANMKANEKMYTTKRAFQNLGKWKSLGEKQIESETIKKRKIIKTVKLKQSGICSCWESPQEYKLCILTEDMG